MKMPSGQPLLLQTALKPIHGKPLSAKQHGNLTGPPIKTMASLEFGATSKEDAAPKATPKTERLAYWVRRSMFFGLFAAMVPGCFLDFGPPKSAGFTAPLTVEQMKLATPDGLKEDEYPFEPLSLPFDLDMPGTKKLSSKDFTLIINTNRDQNNRLGLYQPNGITRQHLEAAKQLASSSKIKDSLDKCLNNFAKLDQDGNGTITLGDVSRFVNKEYTWYHRPFFSKQEALEQARSRVAQHFGITQE